METDSMKAITILSSYFYLLNFKYNKYSIIARSKRFTCPCISFRLSPPFFEYLKSDSHLPKNLPSLLH